MKEELLKKYFQTRLREKIAGKREVHIAVCKRRDFLFAFEVRYVQESIIPPPLKMIPLSPPFLLGIIAHRGRIIPVIDIKDFCGAPPLDVEKVRMIVVTDGIYIAGILMNGYPYFLTLDEDEIQDAQAVFPEYSRYIVGLAKAERQVIPILNVSEIFGEIRRVIERK